MKTQKKGFTLIELMVVIVIIGILAAIAIPKLFGMSAKAKASEVGPAAGTWSKLVSAYVLETGDNDDTNQPINFKNIGYTAPGTPGKNRTKDESEKEESYTDSFTYKSEGADNVDKGTWTAANAVDLNDCKKAAPGTWKLEMTRTGTEPEVTPPTDTGCEILTPNFIKLGKKSGT